MRTVAFDQLPSQDQSTLREAAARLSRALNKASNPVTSAIARANQGQHYGNNIFLSNCSLSCAEANALAAAVAAGDPRVHTLYLVSGRQDSKAPQPISPCGNCRQMLCDFARLAGQPIRVLWTTNELQEVVMSDSEELLPGSFIPASLATLATPRWDEASPYLPLNTWDEIKPGVELRRDESAWRSNGPIMVIQVRGAGQDSYATFNLDREWTQIAPGLLVKWNGRDGLLVEM